MPRKKCLNEKRLTRKQVNELIASGAVLHQEFTACFAETYWNGYKNQPIVYQLKDDRFLCVFDPKEPGIGGKGDIYDRNYLLRWINWVQRVREDDRLGRNSSVDHWHFYSRHKTALIDRRETLMAELAARFNLSIAQLDYSYASLDRLSVSAETSGVEAVQQELYDHLVAYVGEVLRRRLQAKGIGAEWTIDRPTSRTAYPAIGADGWILMPINVVWNELRGLEAIDLRQGTTNEMRRFSLRQR